MIIALIFMVAFAALAGYGIYQAVTFTKSPLTKKEFRPFIIKQLIFMGPDCLLSDVVWLLHVA